MRTKSRSQKGNAASAAVSRGRTLVGVILLCASCLWVGGHVHLHTSSTAARSSGDASSVDERYSDSMAKAAHLADPRLGRRGGISGAAAAGALAGGRGGTGKAAGGRGEATREAPSLPAVLVQKTKADAKFTSLDLDEAVEEIVDTWLAEANRTGDFGALDVHRYHLHPPGTAATHPPYPWQKVMAQDGSDTGVVAQASPAYDEYYHGAQARGLFLIFKKRGHIILGLSSYQAFPAKVTNNFDDRVGGTPEDDEIYQSFDGWLHCFREPDKVLPPGVPRILMSESDFYDPFRDDSGGRLVPRGLEKKWDLVHNNLGGPWNDYARNWTIAKECIKKLTAEGYKILVIGRNLNDEPGFPELMQKGLLGSTPFAQWRDLLQIIETARAIWIPNVSDASPRVAVEAMMLNVPVVMNWHILGGWKYITDQTGVFFSSPDDVVASVRKLFSPEGQAKLTPREWYIKNSGYDKTTLRLGAFLELAVGPERLAHAKRLVSGGAITLRRRSLAEVVAGAAGSWSEAAGRNWQALAERAVDVVGSWQETVLRQSAAAGGVSDTWCNSAQQAWQGRVVQVQKAVQAVGRGLRHALRR